MKKVIFDWRIPKAKRKNGARLNQKLFGYKLNSQKKTYYYDGLLGSWKNGDRQIHGGVKKLSDGCYIIPEKFSNEIKHLLLDLDIDFTVVPYDENNNITNYTGSDKFRWER